MQRRYLVRKHSTFVPLSVLNIDPESSVPVYRQLYSSLRNAILNVQLAPGTQLPSTRALALELGFARGTILNAYEQLFAAGNVDQVQWIIIIGSRQALARAEGVLLDPGEDALAGDPCYPGARRALLGAGTNLIPVPVDKEGIDIIAGMARSATARLAYV